MYEHMTVEWQHPGIKFSVISAYIVSIHEVWEYFNARLFFITRYQTARYSWYLPMHWKSSLTIHLEYGAHDIRPNSMQFWEPSSGCCQSRSHNFYCLW